MRLLTAVLASCLLFGPLNAAEVYSVGDVVADHAFTDYKSGKTVQLHDYGADGGILVLEWFAWWCPFCASAAGQVKAGIVDHYAEAGGNPHGLPVKHISLNVQGGARAQSDIFIKTYGLGTVLQDYDREFFARFNPGGGQPLFVVLNAEPDSPDADRWEVLFTQLTYGSTTDITGALRAVIDAIRPAAPGGADTLLARFPGATRTGDWVGSAWFGWMNAATHPWVYHLDFGYLQIPDGGADVFFYSARHGWVFTRADLYPVLYRYTTGSWAYYLPNTQGSWFYDFATAQWTVVTPE